MKLGSKFRRWLYIGMPVLVGLSAGLIIINGRILTMPPPSAPSFERSQAPPIPPPISTPISTPTAPSADGPYIVFSDKVEPNGSPTKNLQEITNGNSSQLTKASNHDAYVILPKFGFSTISPTTPPANPKTFQRWEDLKSISTRGYHGVRVNFATDRQYTIEENKVAFTSDPGSTSYGYCYVAIPPLHKTGIIESPSIIRLEFEESPEKHVMILRTEILSRQAFMQDIGWLADVSKSGNAFVFIHGFNVSFEDAAKRTAQMAYDLNFDGVPIFYSWPSRNSASLTGYEADERNIELSEQNIKDFLAEILVDDKVSNVFVIGHSMGTRGLAKAVGSLAVENPSVIGKLKAVILAAPDIDADLFKRQIAPRLLMAQRSVTLYASSNDRALLMSQKLHGYPRAGDSGAGLVVLKGVDTIDASDVDTSLLGHSYYGDIRSIIDDMHYIIQESVSIDRRSGLRSAGDESNKYWKFKP
ncbi:alpha/beta hydrolase [Pseudomonas atacamensis]|uniref:alpha/beta hydrolase n=1 Tax=Pseudomonas atacamensis TaxID=2565368 RepID=UPI0021D7F705|nr:alpha/beta hydrolase [Pseudomonas atacamensis]